MRAGDERAGLQPLQRDAALHQLIVQNVSDCFERVLVGGGEGQLLFAVEFDGSVEWAKFDTNGKPDYHAATIRSRMDSYFEFKYLCNVLIPETKTSCYPMPASLGALRQLHQEGVVQLEDSGLPSEDRLKLLKRLMTLELHYFAYAY